MNRLGKQMKSKTMRHAIQSRKGQSMMEYVLLICLIAVPLLLLFATFFLPGKGFQEPMGTAFITWFQGLGRAVSLPIP